MRFYIFTMRACHLALAERTIGFLASETDFASLGVGILIKRSRVWLPSRYKLTMLGHIYLFVALYSFE
jgi:hypothetical protein